MTPDPAVGNPPAWQWVEVDATVVRFVDMGGWCDHCALPSVVSVEVVFTMKLDPTKVITRGVLTICTDHELTGEE